MVPKKERKVIQSLSKLFEIRRILSYFRIKEFWLHSLMTLLGEILRKLHFSYPLTVDVFKTWLYVESLEIPSEIALHICKN